MQIACDVIFARIINYSERKNGVCDMVLLSKVYIKILKVYIWKKLLTIYYQSKFAFL